MEEQQYLGSQEHFEDSINEHYDQMEEMAKQQEKGMMDEIYKDMQPTLPDELDKEAKELVEKFRMVICQMDDDTMTFSATDKDGNDISDDIRIDAYEGSLGDAKQCAIIHCDLMLKELPMYTGNLNPRWKHYKDLKQKIEAL